MVAAATPPAPSRAERLSDAAVHAIGLALAAMAVPALIWLAATRRGDAGTLAAVAVYCVCLLAMLTCSAVYNVGAGGRWTPVWRRLDHSAIYLKIAGTYTPLVALSGVAAGPLLVGLWTAALGGTSLKVLAPGRWRRVGLTLYLAMGWVGVLAGGEVIAALAPASAELVKAGGLLYTAGVVFYLWERLPFHTAIWHGFVLLATALLYAAIAVEVVHRG
jgi:hemolysin III